MTPWPPRRIHVIGTSGSGKTTYARAVAAALDLPHRELDEVFWGPDWTKKDPAEGRALLRDFLTGEGADGWVVDGNWVESAAGLLDHPDLVVWLDYSRPVVMSRVIRRTLWRSLTQEELWHGNRENPWSLLRRDPDENIVRWAWVTHGPNRQRALARMATGQTPIVRLRAPRAARDWLRGLAATP